jgi:hypothetical protein
MRKKCEDCKGEGRWLGLRTYHDCKSCHGTGWIPLSDGDGDEEDDEPDEPDRFCVDEGRPILDGGYVYAVCAGGDEEEEPEPVQLQFPFFIS